MSCLYASTVIIRVKCPRAFGSPPFRTHKCAPDAGTPSWLRADNGVDNWLCATLLVAAEGKLKLPKISSSADMRKALTTLGSVTPDTLLAFELLWTPQVGGVCLCDR
jgi:uncharacterized membrane protein